MDAFHNTDLTWLVVLLLVLLVSPLWDKFDKWLNALNEGSEAPTH